jgi:ribosomal protein S18 acetylase RimI-like enzyme
VISFAPVSEDDFERLLALRVEAMGPHLRRLGRFDPARSRVRFREAFDPETMRLIHADGVFAGCVTLARKDDHHWLGQFYIVPAHQGRGLGTKLLALLLAETDASGLPVRMSVLKRNPAARLYERHGFRRTGEDEWDVYYERPAGRR